MQSLSTFFGNVKRAFMEMGDGGLEVVGPPQISCQIVGEKKTDSADDHADEPNGVLFAEASTPSRLNIYMH